MTAPSGSTEASARKESTTLALMARPQSGGWRPASRKHVAISDRLAGRSGNVSGVAGPSYTRTNKKPGPRQKVGWIPGVNGAEHRVQSGDLRLGNESARHSRFPLPATNRSPRTFDFLRVYGPRFRARLHESSRGFSSFMCPACARTFVLGLTLSAAERDPSRRTARLLARARVRTLRTRRPAPPQGFEQFALVPIRALEQTSGQRARDQRGHRQDRPGKGDAEDEGPVAR